MMNTVCGPISGAHLNPAVTLSGVMIRKMDVVTGLLYVVAQMAGAVSGTALCKSMVSATGSLAAVQIGAGVSESQAFVCEIVLTTVLVIVCLSVAVDPVQDESPLAPLLVGITVAGDIMVGGWISGACMNPARAFGPALLANMWTTDGCWIFFTAPLVGAIVATALWRIVLKPQRATATIFIR